MQSDPRPSSNNLHLVARYRRGAFRPLLAAGAIALALVSLGPVTHAAGPRTVADALTATTANMTPSGVNLRLQIIEWQEAETRSEVVATLAAGADAAPPLAKLPTVGYIWPNASPVGYSVKYAHRVAADGGERITLVTDRRLGSYDYKGWSVPSTAAAKDLPYSVIELYLNGSGAGTGNLSLAAEVQLDEQAGTVSLAGGAGAASLLTNVKREPTKP
jgi:hypothetical protein